MGKEGSEGKGRLSGDRPVRDLRIYEKVAIENGRCSNSEERGD